MSARKLSDEEIADLAARMTKRDMTGGIRTLRGFGTTYDLTTGRVRNWYVGSDGVKRWADDDKPAGDGA